ncbi:hypothetical protein Vretimale_5882 [Volvox reticuliferus]|uniref:Uncharacterized protein n=1 Tax=Volvox reticuliferus TaxID=1737510 RepID=A0A8J4G6E4_9CHLO|nr:hypothetical protein Vretifemale_5913 [Volvox reticuliferus]GIM01014.1 hypothetical protein Vretimale_5882 [Volvox reticuliferus]
MYVGALLAIVQPTKRPEPLQPGRPVSCPNGILYTKLTVTQSVSHPPPLRTDVQQATTSFVIAAHSGYGTDVVSAVTVGGTILLVPAVLVALQLPRGMGITLRLASTPVPSAAGGE